MYKSILPLNKKCIFENIPLMSLKFSHCRILAHSFILLPYNFIWNLVSKYCLLDESTGSSSKPLH